MFTSCATPDCRQGTDRPQMGVITMAVYGGLEGLVNKVLKDVLSLARPNLSLDLSHSHITVQTTPLQGLLRCLTFGLPLVGLYLLYMLLLHHREVPQGAILCWAWQIYNRIQFIKVISHTPSFVLPVLTLPS